MKHYSKQRETVLRVLRSTDTHPTAAAVCRAVREEIPGVSLGTVYRNLTLLRDEGEIRALSVGDGNEHFDGDTSPHLHLHCRVCGKIEDLFVSDDACRRAGATGFLPEYSVTVVHGICAACRENNHAMEIIQ